MMNSTTLISFLGQSIDDLKFLEFLETHHFSTKKFPKTERGQHQKAKPSIVTSKLHGIELHFGFEKEVLGLYKIVFFKPQSDGLQLVFDIDYPFGLYLNQKMADYESILGDFVGFDEPQSRDYCYKKYAITIVFDPQDADKKIKSIEISIKQNEN